MERTSTQVAVTGGFFCARTPMTRTRDNKGRYQVERQPLYKDCVICSTSFYCRSQFRFETGKYCSRACLGQANRKRLTGNAPYKMTDETRRRISKAKTGVPIGGGRKAPWATGERNWNWKGGVTDADTRERKRFKATMQKLIFQRDNYTCQMCGARGELQVDHIQSWSEYVDLRFSMDNCRTLCKGCHYFVTYGKRIPDPKMPWGHNLGRKEAS